MGKGRTFTREFKENAVHLAQTSGKSVSQVARDLGISIHTLHDWRRQARLEHRLPVPENEDLEQENRRLKQELEMLREESTILKKAIAYFAQPPKR
jgi:transposase